MVIHTVKLELIQTTTIATVKTKPTQLKPSASFNP
jgi:hypothetical protein